MDSQLQSYPLLVERCMGQRVKGLIYNVIRKPSIRHKQGETFDEFIQRISDEYSEKTTEYFWREEIPFQPKHAERVWRDLQLVIWDLYGKHQMFREIGRDNPDSAVLDENNWPRDTRRCHDYNSRCEFWYMCRYGRNKYTEPFLFKQRKGLERGDIIYEEGPKENQAGAKTD